MITLVIKTQEQYAGDLFQFNNKHPNRMLPKLDVEKTFI